MVIDLQYKLSAFGDFESIQPTADNMLTLLHSFKDYGLIPSIFQELKLDNGVPQPTAQQRIAMISSNSLEQMSVASNRIDYEIALKDDTKLEGDQREEVNNRIFGAFGILFDKFNKRASRLALNTESLNINLTPEEVNHFISRYTNPISLYNDSPLDEWSTRLMVQKKIPINNQEEKINIITIISKALINKQVNGLINESKGFSVQLDINTAPENGFQRFSVQDLKDFTRFATDCADKIILEMG